MEVAAAPNVAALFGWRLSAVEPIGVPIDGKLLFPLLLFSPPPLLQLNNLTREAL